MVADYVSEAQFREFIKDPSANDAATIGRCITAASREVDKDCGRFFYPDATATALTFATHDSSCCELSNDGMRWDISSTTDLLVKTDSNGDGSYDATWTINTDFILEPVNRARYGIRGWPWESIRATGNRQFPTCSSGQPYPVQVTARWGWAAVPDGITTATLLMAKGMYRKGEQPTFNELGALNVRSDPLYVFSIQPFIRVERLVA